MRKIICLLLCLLLFVPCAGSAAPVDYSAMSVAELQDIISSARNELLKKTVKADGKLFILEDEDFQIYLTGDGELDWEGKYLLEIVVINNTDIAVTVQFDHIVINGWETYPRKCSVSNIGAGKEKKGNIILILEDAEIFSIDEVEEIELTFSTLDSSTNETKKSYGPITIYYDGSSWSK